MRASATTADPAERPELSEAAKIVGFAAVALGMFLALQGVNLGVTKLVTNTVQVSNLDLVPGYRALKDIFGSTFGIGGSDFQIAIVWWIAFTIIGS